MTWKPYGRSWFPQVTWFYTLYPLLAIICCWYITRLSIKVTFTNTAFITLGSKCYYRWDLYFTWAQNVITDETFITLGSKCYYRWDLYYTWVQLLHMCLLAPEMIPTPKWSPTLKWSRNDPHFSSCWPRNDPQLILGMELVFHHGIITNLLQSLRS